jgi:hypothetical protein
MFEGASVFFTLHTYTHDIRSLQSWDDPVAPGANGSFSFGSHVEDPRNDQKDHKMSISSIASLSATPLPPSANQPKVDRPNDGDGDAGDAPKVQASPAPGTGVNVDKTA